MAIFTVVHQYTWNHTFHVECTQAPPMVPMTNINYGQIFRAASVGRLEGNTRFCLIERDWKKILIYCSNINSRLAFLTTKFTNLKNDCIFCIGLCKFAKWFNIASGRIGVNITVTFEGNWQSKQAYKYIVNERLLTVCGFLLLIVKSKRVANFNITNKIDQLV